MRRSEHITGTDLNKQTSGAFGSRLCGRRQKSHQRCDKVIVRRIVFKDAGLLEFLDFSLVHNEAELHPGCRVGPIAR